jgi:hypothetical protein
MGLKRREVTSMLKGTTFSCPSATHSSLAKLIRLTLKDAHPCPSYITTQIEILRIVGVPKVVLESEIRHRPGVSWSERFCSGVPILSVLETDIVSVDAGQHWAGGSLCVELDSGAFRGDHLRFTNVSNQQRMWARNCARYVTNPITNTGSLEPATTTTPISCFQCFGLNPFKSMEDDMAQIKKAPQIKKVPKIPITPVCGRAPCQNLRCRRLTDKNRSRIFLSPTSFQQKTLYAVAGLYLVFPPISLKNYSVNSGVPLVFGNVAVARKHHCMHTGAPCSVK